MLFALVYLLLRRVVWLTVTAGSSNELLNAEVELVLLRHELMVLYARWAGRVADQGFACPSGLIREYYREAAWHPISAPFTASRSIATPECPVLLAVDQELGERRASWEASVDSRETSGATATAGIFFTLAGSRPSPHLLAFPHASQPQRNGRSRRRSARCPR